MYLLNNLFRIILTKRSYVMQLQEISQVNKRTARALKKSRPFIKSIFNHVNIFIVLFIL